jgi:hypothetical protein
VLVQGEAAYMRGGQANGVIRRVQEWSGMTLKCFFADGAQEQPLRKRKYTNERKKRGKERGKGDKE